MRRILVIIIMFSANTIFGQINLDDSTVQIVAYWNAGDKQSYAVTLEKLKINESDTTLRETTTYDIEINVLESTDKTYTIQWYYKNILTSNQNPLIQKLMGISKEMSLVFKTDEFGVFVEVVNWKDIRDYYVKSISMIEEDFKHIPGLDKILHQTLASYTTKEAIESASIKDIQQFHTFHGGRFKLGEVIEGKMKVPNILGIEPFDSNITVYLDEINKENNNYIMRAYQEIDKEQLISSTLGYLTGLAKSLDSEVFPSRDDIKDLSNETHTASRIHETGWVIYSIQTTTVSIEGVKNIEKRIIELN